MTSQSGRLGSVASIGDGSLVERQSSRGTLLVGVLALAAGSFSVLQSLVAPALPTLARDLSVTPASAAWILTAYLLAASVATAVLGKLGDVVGKRRVLLGVLVALTVGTVICALADSLPVLILGRVVQGMAGALFPLSFGLIRDGLAPARVPTAIGILSAILGVGGGIGIVLAGPIVDNLSWHWLFWGPLVLIVPALVAAYFVIQESPVRARTGIGWVGALLLSAALVALLLGISEGSSWGWTSGRVIGLFVAAVVIGAAWVWSDAHSATPLVDMRMLRAPAIWPANLISLLLGVGLFGSFILIPQMLQLPESTGFGFGASITESGLYLLPSTVAMLVFGPMAGRLNRLFGGKTVLGAGTLLTALAFVVLAVAHSAGWQIILAMVLSGAGIGLAFAAMVNVVVVAVSEAETGIATGINTLVRSIGGGVGSQVLAAIITANVATSGLPAERGFTISFIVTAGLLLVGFGSCLLLPNRPRPDAV